MSCVQLCKDEIADGLTVMQFLSAGNQPGCVCSSTLVVSNWHIDKNCVFDGHTNLQLVSSYVLAINVSLLWAN